VVSGHCTTGPVAADRYPPLVIVEEPVRGTFAYLEHPGLLALPGLEQMHRFRRKEVPYGPIYYLTGADLIEVDEGVAAFSLPPTAWLRSAAGIPTGGILAFLGDAALGGAVITALPPGTILATSELSMNYLRPPSLDAGDIVARGTLIQAGRSLGLSEASVRDGAGRLLAHATSRCVLIELGVPDAPPPEGPIPWPTYDRPHPFQRPAEGEVVPPEVWERTSGLDMMRAWIRRELPWAPMSNLIGTDPLEADEGRFVCSIPASPWFATAGGTFYGGALALLADYAMGGAVHTTVPAGTSWATLDLKVNFLRPVAPDDRPLEARASVVHRGRTIAVTSAEIRTAEDKVAALATGSVMILPDRPWRTATTPIDEARTEPA
jgi:uncharacterized protein (TIGR00369 family)